MARAFHYSGIPSIVMSLWKVPDQETKTIMIDFYRYLKKGKSKSEALRMAKLRYLDKNEGSILAHPYYWAGFVINGNTEPLSINIVSYPWGWMVFAVFGILLVSYLFKKFK